MTTKPKTYAWWCTVTRCVFVSYIALMILHAPLPEVFGQTNQPEQRVRVALDVNQRKRFGPASFDIAADIIAKLRQAAMTVVDQQEPYDILLRVSCEEKSGVPIKEIKDNRGTATNIRCDITAETLSTQQLYHTELSSSVGVGTYLRPWTSKTPEEDFYDVAVNQIRSHVRYAYLPQILRATLAGEGEIAVLLAAAKDSNPSTREDAIRSLAKVNDGRAATAIIEALSDKEDFVQRIASLSLPALKEQSGLVDQVLSSMSSPDPKMRKGAIMTLQEMKVWKDPTVPRLLVALQDSEASVRAQAAAALGESGRLDAIDPLIVAMSDQDAGVRMLAAYALGSLRSPKAVDALITALDDPAGDYVTTNVAVALGQIGDKRAVPALLRLFQRNRNSFWVKDALGKLGAKVE